MGSVPKRCRQDNLSGRSLTAWSGFGGCMESTVYVWLVKVMGGVQFPVNFVFVSIEISGGQAVWLHPLFC